MTPPKAEAKARPAQTGQTRTVGPNTSVLRTPMSKQRKARALYRDGWTQSAIGRDLKLDRRTVAAIINHVTEANGRSWKEALNAETDDDTLPAVKADAELSDEARRALADFGYFRNRYFGRISSPWQEEAAYRVVDLLATPDKEYLVVNAPPGSGKSTLFTHDIASWVACRNRAIRCLIGSRTEKQARQYTGRLRRSFERLQPLKATSDELARGRALDGESTLVADFGRFRPLKNDLWQIAEFVIAQAGDIAIEDKEPSFAAYGMDSGFLGGRYDLVIWDDLVDKRTLRTADAREGLQDWWESEAETRLEPGGLLILQGQRMGPDDLYRYALNLAVDADEGDERSAKYHHIIYRAHYEDRCTATHSRHASPYPDGCLLDPVRLPWRELRTIEANRSEKYRVLYQQEDVDPANVLVNPIWIKGGRGTDGIDYPGCLDDERGACELPRGLSGDLVSIATADPSPTKFWAIEWWVYHPDSEQRFLMDLIRQAMDAGDFLDWNYNEAAFSGVMEEWQVRSADLGVPISCWIVEANVAQRFLLQYEHVKRWQARRGVDILPHQTHRHKADPAFGPQILAPHYQFGRIRLPARQGDPGRLASLKLIDEVTRWPEARTDDCVMAQWFMEYQLPNIFTPGPTVAPAWRPSWLAETENRWAVGA